MSKFKVGDKVRTDIHVADAHEDGRYGISSEEYWNDAATRTIEKIAFDSLGITLYKISDDPTGFLWPEYALVSAESRREFIVIHRSGNVMTAEHRVNREVIKSAKATCAPSDTFDFDAGAKLAFDRLMGQQNIDEAVKAWNKPSPAPEPPKFYTGKVVMVGCKLDDRKHLINTLFEFKDGYYVGREQRGIDFCFGPYKSFDQIVKDHSMSTWTEVKVSSDV